VYLKRQLLQNVLYHWRRGVPRILQRGDAHFWLTYPPPPDLDLDMDPDPHHDFELDPDLHPGGGGVRRGGDACASCASPLGTPLIGSI
jgi:hypothetical protein